MVGFLTKLLETKLKFKFPLDVLGQYIVHKKRFFKKRKDNNIYIERLVNKIICLKMSYYFPHFCIAFGWLLGSKVSTFPSLSPESMVAAFESEALAKRVYPDCRDAKNIYIVDSP